MVTLITEKLQNQSLDDLTCKACEAGPRWKSLVPGMSMAWGQSCSGDTSDILDPLGQRSSFCLCSGASLPEALSSLAWWPGVGSLHSTPSCEVLTRNTCSLISPLLTRWPAGSSAQTLKNSKSLCSLDCEDDDEDDAQAKTVVSSPCGSQGLVGSGTPGSSPRAPGPCPASSWGCREPVAGAGEGGSSGDPSDWDSAGEEGIFPLDHGDLDLEQIENN
ncbi:Protein FAM53A [Sciurus carolinensis]|uniref:Protein FAM53A n=1 Tax=Sciurus carolinensis TaxID=30640 RepID=A0AA41N4F1_SCICA|nr:Protein FAM53A [Sciurus carolinensis]